MDDDDHLAPDNFVDLDLNQESTAPAPLRAVSRFWSLLDEMETARDGIEDRIRQLESVTALTRQRQRWRQTRNSMEISHTLYGNDDVGSFYGTAERRGKGCKRDSSHLVAKALEMDYGVKKVDDEGGSFYDCNICLHMARDPVLTCCGHLFCWGCFYKVSYADSTSKDCPVCEGEVSDSSVIPIYGNGGSDRVPRLKLSLTIPPRPKARRVESVRQQHVAHGPTHIPVLEALRRIRIGIGAMEDQTRQQDGGNGSVDSDMQSQEGGRFT